MKVTFLVGIDLQDDFITGALANKDAEPIPGRVVKFLEKFDLEEDMNHSPTINKLFLTQDTHAKATYPYSKEKDIPEHCFYHTKGWYITEKVSDYVVDNVYDYRTIIKTAGFGDHKVSDAVKEELESVCDVITEMGVVPEVDIIIFGLDTDYCVISNAIMIKNSIPSANVIIKEKLCAGSTPEMHEKAIEMMEHLGIIIDREDI